MINITTTTLPNPQPQPTKKNRNMLNSLPVLLAGKVLFHPFERVRIIAQANPEMIKCPPHLPTRFKDSMEVARYIIRQEGRLALWRRAGPTVLQQGAFALLRLPIAHALAKHSQGGDFMANTYRSSVAALVFSALLHPLEVVRTRMACDMMVNGADRIYGSSGRSIIGELSALSRKEGIAGLYRGFRSSTSGILLAFLIPTSTMAAAQSKGKLRLEQFLVFFLTSSIVGSGVWYAFDTIARRSMMATGEEALKYKTNSFIALGSAIRKEGIRSLFRGAGASITYCFGSSLVVTIASLFTLTEDVLRVIGSGSSGSGSSGSGKIG